MPEFKKQSEIIVRNTDLEHGPVWVNKTWEDPRLPDQFEAYRWQAVFKGHDRKTGLLRFEGIGFGIPVKKMTNLSNLKYGDIIEVVRFRHEGSDYDGDGIISFTNIRTGESAGCGIWQKAKEDEIKKIRGAVGSAAGRK